MTTIAKKDMHKDHEKVFSARKKKEIFSGIWRIVLGIVFLSPLIIGLVFSFEPDAAISTLPPVSQLIADASLNNYNWVLNNIPIIQYSLNSLVVCAIVIGAQLIVASLSAYALSFFTFRGKGFFFSLILIAMMIPGQVTTLANFLMVQKFNLLNTHIGLALPYLISGAAVFMMRQYYMTIPRDLKCAADIDGCGDIRFLFKIILPNSVPTLISLGIYLFVDTYNQYFWPMLVAQKQHMFTAQIGMNMLVAADEKQYGIILAGAMLSLLIPVVAFIIGQDYMVKGMADGAIKE